MIHAIVFDFDNVIVQCSEACKQKSWSNLFEPQSKDYERYLVAQKYFSEHGGDRFDILASILQLPTIKDSRDHPEVLRLAAKYDSYVQQCIVGIGIAESDIETLKDLATHYPLYIISATPEISLRVTIDKLSELHKVDLSGLFQLILGTPLSKIKNFEKIQNQSQLPYAEMLMVGDGVNDLRSARSVGAKFVGVKTAENLELWRNETFLQIDSIKSLHGLLVKV